MDRSRLEAILEQDEDRRNEKYRDSENKWTIGIGHLMATKVQTNAYSLATGETVEQPTRCLRMLVASRMRLLMKYSLMI